MEQKSKKKKTGLWIIAAVVLALLVFAAVRVATSSKRAERILDEYAYSWNVRCPLMLDNTAELNRVVVLPGRVLVYQVTSSAFTKKSFEELLDLDEFIGNAREKAIAQLLDDPSIKQIRRLGITFRYIYKDAGGVPFAEFDITPEDYK